MTVATSTANELRAVANFLAEVSARERNKVAKSHAMQLAKRVNQIAERLGRPLMERNEFGATPHVQYLVDLYIEMDRATNLTVAIANILERNPPEGRRRLNQDELGNLHKLKGQNEVRSVLSNMGYQVRKKKEH